MDKKLDTRRILFISDLHVPAQHPDALKFLQWLKKKIRPTLVISIGDLLDNEALNLFGKNPDLPGALDELIKAKKMLKSFYNTFPNLHLVRGNHDYRPFRIAKKAGLSQEHLKDMPHLLSSPKGWHWHRDMRLILPTGQECYIAHDVGRGIKKAVSSRAMCIVAGHFHTKFKITYFSNRYSLNFGMNVGCLVDDDHPSFDYSRNSSCIKTRERSVIGTGILINGAPKLIPLILNKNGRWIGETLSNKFIGL